MVDHGTAFEIAGTGAADERSMIAALRKAIGLTLNSGASENMRRAEAAGSAGLQREART